MGTRTLIKRGDRGRRRTVGRIERGGGDGGEPVRSPPGRHWNRRLTDRQVFDGQTNKVRRRLDDRTFTRTMWRAQLESILFSRAPRRMSPVIAPIILPPTISAEPGPTISLPAPEGTPVSNRLRPHNITMLGITNRIALSGLRTPLAGAGPSPGSRPRRDCLPMSSRYGGRRRDRHDRRETLSCERPHACRSRHHGRAGSPSWLPA